eukprot:m.182671 g.182671  ORF g.182671 m.182671 type:complete len:207 (+) comp9997_c0_seq25:913-1533(+)
MLPFPVTMIPRPRHALTMIPRPRHALMNSSFTAAGPPSMPPPPLPPTPAAAPLANSDEAWYAGRMPRNKADELLESSPPGTYLVRESDSRPGDYSLSVAFSIVKHIKISRRGIKYEIAPDSKSFASIQELIRHFQQHSLSRHFPGLDTALVIPFRDALSMNAGAQKSCVPALSLMLGPCPSCFFLCILADCAESSQQGYRSCREHG